MGVAALATILLMGATAQAQVIAKSPPDAHGRFTFEVGLPAQPIYLADGYRAWDHTIPVPPGTVCEVRSFIGWDRGSLGEANLELTVSGYRLYERSEHRERALAIPDTYDAWTCATPACRTNPARLELERGDTLHVHTGASMTGPRTNDGGMSTRVQFAFRLRMSTGHCD